jgi:outer membrane efflux protein
MFARDGKRRQCQSVRPPSVVFIGIVVLAVGTVAAQDSPLASQQGAFAPQSILRTPAIPPERFTGGWSSATAASAGSSRWQPSHAPRSEPAGSVSTAEKPVRHDRIRRITLEQVKQQSADPVASPIARLGQLSTEAAKQHRLGLQADYFPKLGSVFANLHYSEFLGQVLSIRRPIEGSFVQVPVALFSQNQTIAAITFTQPITPLFQVYQAVQIARADERIAMAKAGIAVAKNAADIEVEEKYFRLLIAQRQLISAQFNLRNTENRPSYAAASIESVRGAGQEEPELVEAKKTLVTGATEVKELNAWLNHLMGWPEDTELDLVLPDPLVESISLEEVADKSAAANPDVFEAEQTVVKARAATVLSKLEYVPTVAAVGGYLFQNAIPLVPSNFGYGGVIASYNLFDFGKRERAVKEARARLGMAEIAVQLTKAKVAADVKKTYFELERSRQLSQLAQKIGSSVALMMNASSTGESPELKAARAKVETEMLEADLAHRQAYAHLKSLMGPQR